MTTVTDQDPQITDIIAATEEVKSDCREMLKFRLRKGKDPLIGQIAAEMIEHIEAFNPAAANVGVPLSTAFRSGNAKTAK